jgi:hypothetical protein
MDSLSVRCLASRLLGLGILAEKPRFARTWKRVALSERECDSRFAIFGNRSPPENVEPNVRKWYTAKPIPCSGHNAHFYSPEAPMAVKNLQTLALCVATIHGVRVTGTECMGSMRFGPQASRSLPRLPRPGFYPIPTRPDAELRADNAATAQAVKRTGRSASGVGELPSARLSERSWTRG